MRKIITSAALLLAVSASMAAPSVNISYDYDRANGGQAGWKSQHVVKTGVSLPTALGTVDASLVGQQLVTGVRDNGAGFELGYTNGIKLGGFGLKGRAAYGRVNLIDVGGGGFSGNGQYYSLAAEASMPVTKSVTGFAGYRYTHGLNANTPVAADRFTVGADVALSKTVSLRAGYAFTEQAGFKMNGLTTAISTKF
jgi:hypothetical protein